MNGGQDKMSLKMAPYQSRGKEPYVFRTEKPEGLLGVHADLIAGALTPEEKLYYLLYAPIRQTDQVRFGIEAEPASHAVAVTSKRFIVSKDHHVGGIPPTVETIPFSTVIRVEYGNALLLGWFVIHHVAEGVISRVSMTYTATGNQHFASVIREYRRLTLGYSTDPVSAENPLWIGIFGQTAKPQLEMLKPIITEGERPSHVFRSSEIWGAGKKRRRKACLATEGIFVATDHGLIHAIDDHALSPKMLTFGVNICCIPMDALLGAAHIEKLVHGHRLSFLQLEIGRGHIKTLYELSFDEKRSDNSQHFITEVRDKYTERMT